LRILSDLVSQVTSGGEGMSLSVKSDPDRSLAGGSSSSIVAELMIQEASLAPPKGIDNVNKTSSKRQGAQDNSSNVAGFGG